MVNNVERFKYDASQSDDLKLIRDHTPTRTTDGSYPGWYQMLHEVNAEPEFFVAAFDMALTDGPDGIYDPATLRQHPEIMQRWMVWTGSLERAALDRGARMFWLVTSRMDHADEAGRQQIFERLRRDNFPFMDFDEIRQLIDGGLAVWRESRPLVGVARDGSMSFHSGPAEATDMW